MKIILYLEAQSEDQKKKDVIHCLDVELFSDWSEESIKNNLYRNFWYFCVSQLYRHYNVTTTKELIFKKLNTVKFDFTLGYYLNDKLDDYVNVLFSTVEINPHISQNSVDFTHSLYYNENIKKSTEEIKDTLLNNFIEIVNFKSMSKEKI